MSDKKISSFTGRIWSLCLLLAATGIAAGQDDVQVLEFSFMLSNSTNGSSVEQDTSGVAAAVALALDAINNDSSVLANYYLKYSQVLNSQCERTTSLGAFFEDITSSRKIFLLGCGCSISTASVGEISHLWQIIQMAYASLTPVISDRSAYPKMFSMLPTALSYQPVILSLMDRYNWKRLVVVSQLENEFDLLRERLVSYNESNTDIMAITFHSYEDVASAVTFERDYRIYFLNMYERHARRVICEAAKRDMGIHYPRYVFIVPGTYDDFWWTVNDVNCTVNQMEQVLNYSLAIATYPMAESNNSTTEVQLTYEEFLAQYGANNTFAGPFAYDGLWAMAFAFNGSVNLNLTNEEMTSEVMSRLNQISFTGLTGEVSFNENGTRNEMSPRVLQYRFTDNSSLVLIGTVDNGSFVNESDDETVWPIIVPFDGTPLTELRAVLLPLFVILYILTTVSILFAIGCAIVNFALRNKKVIRLTSPNLNYLIILGCILMMISAYCYAYPRPDYTVLYVMCITRAFTQNVGYMLCFGTICAKMGRVYFIFHNVSPSKKRRSIQDWQLLLIVLGLACFDAFIATVALAIDPYKPREVEYQERPTDYNEYGILVNIRSLVCESDRSIIWIGVLFLTKFLVQIVAVFFAFQTRKVKIKALNDAKVIAIIIYVSSGLLTVLLIAALSVRGRLNADAGVFGFGLNIVSTVVLLLLFIPKWHNLYKDPEGKNIFEGGQATFSSMPGGPSEQDVSRLVDRIEELEERLGRHEHVTPSLPRKRFLSSTADFGRSTGATSTLGLMAANRRGNRSMSFSPGPDVTASLPLHALSTTPLSSPLPKITNNGGVDSGASTMNSTQSESNDNSPLSKKANITLTIEEADEPANNNGLSATSQTPLTDSTHF